MSLNQLNQPLLLSADPDDEQQEQRAIIEGQHNGADKRSLYYNYSNYKYGSLQAPYHSRLGAQANHQEQYSSTKFQQYQGSQQQPLSSATFMPARFSPNQAARKQGSSSSYLVAGGGGVMSPKSKWVAIGLLLAMSVACLYGVWSWHRASSSAANSEPFRRKLKMVNLFTRHGDRAPSDSLPLIDRHREQVRLFWPNGLHNLTDIGRLRAHKVGLEMRRRYDDYLGYNSSHILAFSSTIYRCIETMEIILRALYNTDASVQDGLLLAQQLESCQAAMRDDTLGRQHGHKCRLPTGSGSPDEWRRVKVDTESVPTLVYERLNKCKYRVDHPAPMDSDLLLDPTIDSLTNVRQLKEFLEQRYEHAFNFSTNALWSTVSSELNLVRSQSTIEYIRHYSDWVNRPIIRGAKFNVTMFELLEAVTVLLYRDRIQGPAHYVQNSPVVTSLVESQLVALGHNATNDRQRAYKNKRMVLYTSHDSVLQQFVQSLGLINFEGSYEERFAKWHKASDLDQFLNGLRMCRYGFSIRFELWQLEPLRGHRQSRSGPSNRMAVGGDSGSNSADCKDRSRRGKKPAFNIVEAAIYNKEDAKFDSVEYELVELGTVCRKQFMQKYPGPSSREELESFYDGDFEIDTRFACPFDLFRNVTSELMLDEQRLEELCHYSGGSSGSHRQSSTTAKTT